MNILQKVFYGSEKLYNTLLSEMGMDYFTLKENTIANQASLFTCGRIISDNISTIPISVFRIKNENRLKDREDHRHFLLNRRPNSLMNSQVWKSSMVYQLIKTGNAFSRIHRYQNEKDKLFGQPKEFEFLTNVDTTKYHTSKDGFHYYILIDENGKEIDKVPFFDMIHLRGFGDGVFGLNALEVLKPQLNVNDLAYQTMNKHYLGGGRPEMFLQSTLTGRGAENVETAIDEWEKKGSRRAKLGGFRRIPGNTTLVPWQVNLQESQVLDTVKHNKADIAALFGIPVFMLGDYTESKFQSIEYLTRFFNSMTIRPNAHIWRKELEDKLLTDKEWQEGMSIEFNTNSIIETDFTTKADYYQKMLMNGTVNNKWVAEKEGLPIPETGDKYFISNNHAEFEGNMLKLELANQKTQAEINKINGEMEKTRSSAK